MGALTKWSGAGLLLLAGFSAGWLAITSMDALFYSGNLRDEPAPCLEIGAPYHHRLRPLCTESMKTPRGRVSFRVNEDGIRDQAREKILAHPRRVLVMGDSFVEGWWTGADQTFGAVLSTKFPGTYFINGGLRSTGPAFQAGRIAELVRLYRPAGILWLLNDTDEADDRLACAVSGPEGFSAPEFELAGWQQNLPAKFRRMLYARKWTALVDGATCDPCAGIGKFARAAAGVPLLPFYLAAESPSPTEHYRGHQADREKTKACLAANQLSFTEAGPRHLAPAEVEQFFWAGDFHLNPEGVLFVSDGIAPAVKAWLARLRLLGGQ